MNRSTRRAMATQTVEIVESGSYRSPAGKTVEIADAVRGCLDATRFFTPEDLQGIRREVLARPSGGHVERIEVVDETTLAGVARLLADGPDPVATLNFASAKNPGGGFLGGSQAQEESLARSSALYASLRRGWDYYKRHRAGGSLLYSNAMILSPDCPVIRDDDGTLLAEPRRATFITSAAPNAGAVARSRPEDIPLIPEVFRQRTELVLALAAFRGCHRIVLGAWGCGVFRNDPAMVAAAFMGHLRSDRWSGRFERVVFSILDTSAENRTLEAFRRAVDRSDG